MCCAIGKSSSPVLVLLSDMADSSLLIYSGLLLVIAITVHSLELVQCDNLAMRAYYKEIGCVPAGDGPCPASYNCDAVRGELPGELNTCRYRGRTIQNGEDFESGYPCSGPCSCEIDDDGAPNFECEVYEYDCPMDEFREGCHFRYDPNLCCPVGIICPENYTSIVRCDYGGKTYYEGMIFSPDNLQCVSCTCLEGFDGTIAEPWCEVDDQKYSLYRPREIDQGCVPIFVQTACFGSDFRCPSNEDDIIPSSSHTDSESQAKCTFGALELNIGDKLSGRSDCTCIIPPDVTCINRSY